MIVYVLCLEVAQKMVKGRGRKKCIGDGRVVEKEEKDKMFVFNQEISRLIKAPKCLNMQGFFSHQAAEILPPPSTLGIGDYL